MSSYIKIASLFILSANIALILPAIAKSDKESESTVSIHKVDFPSNVNPDNQMDLDDNQVYFASEKYKIIKDANERLRKIRSNKSMVTRAIKH